VLRLKSIVDPAVGPTFAGSIMLSLGLLSMAIAAAFMLIQRDYKRLLAYSSIEHMGIAFIGLGVGGPLGLFGGFFHMLNHALAKSAAFYAAGMVLLRHGHKMIDRVTGLLRQAPAVGGGLLLVAIALAGLPPFGLFVSEVLIATAAYRHHPGLACLFLALLALAFATLIAPLTRMALGRPVDEQLAVTHGSNRLMTSALGINLAAMSVIGLLMPAFFLDLFMPMAALFEAKAGLP
jgi:hydrogenase-4 component F